MKNEYKVGFASNKSENSEFCGTLNFNRNHAAVKNAARFLKAGKFLEKFVKFEAILTSVSEKVD